MQHLMYTVYHYHYFISISNLLGRVETICAVVDDVQKKKRKKADAGADERTLDVTVSTAARGLTYTIESSCV